MTKPKYTISIAVHNNLGATKTCLLSLAHWCNREKAEVIVTDNASRDGSLGFLVTPQIKGLLPNLRIVKNDINVGFPAAQNAALKAAQGDYFLALNNDVVVTGRGLLEKMSSALDSDQFLGLCGADTAPSELDSEGHGVLGPRTEYIEGSCLMGKTELLRMYGLFDPAYEFAYAEDSDLSLRLRLGGYCLLRLCLPIRHDRRGTGAGLSAEEKARLDEANRKNHVTLRTRWAAYLASKDRLLGDGERNVRPVAIVTLSRFPDLLEGLVDTPSALPEWQQGIVVADQQPGLRVFRPGWTVVHGVKPFCFARNANIGIAAAGNADVLLVNDDVTGLTPEGVQELQRLAYRYPDVGVLGPSVKGDVGNPLQHCDGRRPELVISRQRLCFVCVYLKRQVLRHLGPLNEEFVEYGGEDCEFCLRAQEAGYKLGITRQVVVEHAHGSTSFLRLMPDTERVAQMNRMRKLIIKKYGGPAGYE
jgi:GT2 family glycosyltransferase